MKWKVICLLVIFHCQIISPYISPTDFTPSRGSTPNSQISFLSREKTDKTFAFDKSPDSKSEPSPTGRKKLRDLFQETPELNASDQKPETNEEQDSSSYQTKPAQLPERATWASSSELAESGDLKNSKKEGRKAVQCCLPSLGESFSFSERRQKMNPVDCSANRPYEIIMFSIWTRDVRGLCFISVDIYGVKLWGIRLWLERS